MRKFLKLLFVVTILASLAVMVTACDRGGNEGPAEQGEVATPPPPPTPPPPGEDVDVEVDEGDPRLAQHNLDENLRFIDPVSISALLWDRSDSRFPDFAQSYWAEWVQSQISADHNIDLEWVQVDRWTQEALLSTLLGADDAPDVSFTFGFSMVETFANMGGITDLSPLLAQYNDWLPHMYGLLTPTNVYWNRNPDTGHMYGIANRMVSDGRINTFVREDWLDILDIAPPTTLEEFEDMLIAFRDNAELLLGENAHRMVPFRLTDDVGWTGDPIISSFIPDAITERDNFIYGFDDRRFMMPNIKEGVRVLNRWFNYDLMWNDFPLHSAGDDVIDDQIILGFVGAFSHNWDYPFRANPGIITRMQEEVGPEANFIVVTPFPNDAGNIVKHMPNATDRTIFFPITNNEPVASLLYLDWMSRLSTRTYLAFGIEGVHHLRHPNGALQSLPASWNEYEMDGDEYVLDDEGNRIVLETHFNWPDHQIIPSLRNFDISLMINGVDLGDEYLSTATVAMGYPGIEPERVMDARSAGLDNARIARRVQTRPIAAQEGMGVPLGEERNRILAVVVADTSIENFDSVWDSMVAGYMGMGGQAIIDERRAAWIERFGDVDFQDNDPNWLVQ